MELVEARWHQRRVELARLAPIEAALPRAGAQRKPARSPDGPGARRQLAIRRRRHDHHPVALGGEQTAVDRQVDGARAARARSRARTAPRCPSTSLPPPSGPIPIQRAPSVRSRCEWANSERVALGRQRALDHAVGARADRRQRLAAREAVAPDVPARDGLADLLGGEPLVLAVLALAQVVVGLGAVAVAGQLGGSARALQRRGEHERELAAGQPLGDRARLRLALLREREVGVAGVAHRAAPLGLAVADDDELAHSRLR